MIEIRHLSFCIGNFALDDVSLDVGSKEYFMLIGKPGSGKTLLLECLAGLRPIGLGRIKIADVDVTFAEPRRRGIGYVPQDLALFPHLTVEKNVAFGLRAMGIDRDEATACVSQVLDLLDLRRLRHRTIEGLSGGERQRVALARALAPRPRVLLLDEPLSTLDEETREGVQRDLKRIQRETGMTTVHVCHDLEEMMALADRTAILRDGRVVQTGSPDQLCRTPADPGVAKFLRLGTVLHGEAQHIAGMTTIEVEHLVFQANGRAIGPTDFLIRSEEVRLSSRTLAKGSNTFDGRVVGSFRAGPTVFVDVLLGPATIRAALSPTVAASLRLTEGESVTVSFSPSAVHLFSGKLADGAPTPRERLA